MSEWKQKELWHRRGTNFLVEVSHHTVDGQDGDHEGPHRWCVYAYLYPEHPHFAEFSGPNMVQEAATIMPLHCGPSLLRWYRGENGGATSVQVGCDYNHLYDRHYTTLENNEDAGSVFSDADDLFAWLEARDIKRGE